MVEFITAAAPPPEAVLAGHDGRRLQRHPSLRPDRDLRPGRGQRMASATGTRSTRASRQRSKARQGVRYGALEASTVMDPETMQPVPRDGETMGEVMFRGNIVMKGYLKNKSSTDKAFAGGWFHSGDLGVMHPDGYIQLKDRSKDIIISGGENISSIEVEDVLYKHPSVRPPPWSPSPTTNGARRPAPSSSCKPGKAGDRRRADRALPREPRALQDAHATWCSRNCRRPRPGRSRNSSCARRRRGCERFFAASSFEARCARTSG